MESDSEVYVGGGSLPSRKLTSSCLQVKVIGLVCNISTTSTNLSEEVEDGTGKCIRGYGWTHLQMTAARWMELSE